MTFANDFFNSVKRESVRGRCLYFARDRCTEFVLAHSIEKGGQLSKIAEAGHVYRLSADRSTLQQNGLPAPRRMGISGVSTFAGFCKRHDNQVFRKIDTEPLTPDRQKIVLYAYRSLCREYFVKENAVAVLQGVKGHSALSETHRRLASASHAGHAVGLEGLKNHKLVFDSALRNNDYTGFEFTYFTSTSSCAFQMSGLLYPEFDFLGRRLQDLGDWTSPPGLLTFFTAPVLAGWAFGFAWHTSSNHACLPFIGSLVHRVADGAKIEDALLRFAASACENHAIRISWWDGLSESARRALLERMRLMCHPFKPVPADYLVQGCEGIADWSFEVAHTSL